MKSLWDLYSLLDTNGNVCPWECICTVSQPCLFFETIYTPTERGLLKLDGGTGNMTFHSAQPPE